MKYFYGINYKKLINAVNTNNINDLKSCLAKATLKKNTPSSCVNNALILAVKKGYSEIVQSLVDSGYIDVNTEKNGFTLLMIAAKNGYYPIVKTLLAAGASPKFVLHYKITALKLAIVGGYLEIVKAIVEAGASPLDGDRNLGVERSLTSTLLAACLGHTEIFKFLLNARISLRISMINICAALCCSASLGHDDVVKAIIEYDTELCKTAYYSYVNIALYLSAKNGHSKIVKNLISYGANVNRISPSKDTPLIKASENGHLETVNALISNSQVDLDISNNNGDTALMIAIQKKHLEIIKSILSVPSNLNQKNHNGETALTLAIKHDLDISYIKHMHNAGADLHVVDKFGDNLLIYAERNMNIDVINYLNENGLENNVKDYYINEPNSKFIKLSNFSDIEESKFDYIELESFSLDINDDEKQPLLLSNSSFLELSKKSKLKF